MASCEQFKCPTRTSFYECANQCQTTLLLEQQAGASPVFSATPSQRELVSSAVLLPLRERPSAVSTVEPPLAPRLSKADDVAQRRELKRERTRARHEPSELRVCVGYASWKTLAMRWASWLGHGPREANPKVMKSPPRHYSMLVCVNQFRNKKRIAPNPIRKMHPNHQ